MIERILSCHFMWHCFIQLENTYRHTVLPSTHQCQINEMFLVSLEIFTTKKKKSRDGFLSPCETQEMDSPEPLLPPYPFLRDQRKGENHCPGSWSDARRCNISNLPHPRRGIFFFKSLLSRWFKLYTVLYKLCLQKQFALVEMNITLMTREQIQ